MDSSLAPLDVLPATPALPTRPLLAESVLQEAYDCIDSILATIADALFILTPAGSIQLVNPTACELLGYAKEDLIGRSFNSFLIEDTLISAPVLAAVQSNQAIATTEKTLRTQTGQVIPVAISGSLHCDRAGTLQRIVCIARDVRERQRTIAALCQSEARNLALLRASPDLILRISRSGIYLDIIPAEDFKNIDPSLVGRHLQELLPPDLAQQYLTLIQQALQTGEIQVCEYELPVKDVLRYQEARLAPCGQDEVLVIVRDTTARKRSEQSLYHSAYHDALTGLPNRALFLKRLQRALDRRQEPYLFAVLFLDLDGFKVINDSLGHLTGDQLLVAIARRLQTCLRSGDTLARFGGDEFTVLLELHDGSEAIQFAEQIQQELAQPFNLEGTDIFTTTSIGIVLSSIAADQPEDLLRSADTALYRAKALGGTRSVVFDAAMHDRAMQRLHLETDLRRALTNAHLQTSQVEFQVYYQPIVALRSGRIRGFEALVRWQHPDRGLVAPGEFIPIAEETGLILPIGWIVLRESCRQMRSWQQTTALPLTMSVNLSVKQFTQPNLVAQIAQILAETDLSPTCLKLEITESAIMDNPEAAARMLRELQALGIQIALDDFGTGYSSLGYLHRFPIDILKIDRSFINKIDTAGEQLEIVRTIVTLAWNLGIEVVAEGVETNKQLAQLRSLHCEYGQGYFFSRPVPAEAASVLIQEACDRLAQ